MILLAVIMVLATVGMGQDYLEGQDYPEGYYPFEEAPGKIPPKVRKPPYLQSKVPCPGTLETGAQKEQSLDNLCGDLNDGLLPLNPLGQSIFGHSYPFELIKNKSLDFFSKTLPILKEDHTLPKVAKLRSRNVPLRDQFRVIRRPIRSVEDQAKQVEEVEAKLEDKVDDKRVWKVEGRGARAFCDDNWGLFCLIYNTVSGKSNSGAAQDRDDNHANSLGAFGGGLGGGPGVGGGIGGGVQPLTPCPSAVEYITPVFARNYQGMWRYVVQIPYEGYFTQTVEVTQCLSSKCHYLSGSCLASPRWVSLLVAEVYYPDALFPATPPRPDFSRAAVASEKPPQGFRHRQGHHHITTTTTTTPTPQYCDGHDEIGCFQVRLYYDWFLIPGSCKCWKQDYFAQFAYRKK